MAQPLPQCVASPVLFKIGQVLQEDALGYRVQVGNDLLSLECAASCLLKPSVRDQVVVALTEERAWIFGVLTSSSPSVTLALGKTARITAGELSIEVSYFHLLAQKFQAWVQHWRQSSQTSRVSNDSALESTRGAREITAGVLHQKADQVLIQADKIALN